MMKLSSVKLSSVKEREERGEPSGMPGKKKGVLWELWKHKSLYLMTVPALCFFLIFSYIPMVGVYYAFIDYDFSKGLFGSPFVGLKNFQYFIAGGLNAPIVYLTRNTILYNLVFIFLGNILQ